MIEHDHPGIYAIILGVANLDEGDPVRMELKHEFNRIARVNGWQAYFRIGQITSTKIGRNDPCSCGSGKKYKKCCGRV